MKHNWILYPAWYVFSSDAEKVVKRETPTLLRSNDMYDALPLIAETKVCESMSLHVILQRHALETRILLFHKLLDILEVFARGGRNIVVGCLERTLMSSASYH